VAIPSSTSEVWSLVWCDLCCWIKSSASARDVGADTRDDIEVGNQSRRRSGRASA
jgi:hypothetical protein